MTIDHEEMKTQMKVIELDQCKFKVSMDGRILFLP